MAISRLDRWVLSVLMAQAAEMLAKDDMREVKGATVEMFESRIRWIAINAPQTTYELEDGRIVRGLNIAEA